MRTKRKSAALAFVLAIALALPMLGGAVFADSWDLDQMGGKVNNAEGTYELDGANVIVIKQANAAFIFVIGSTDVSDQDLIDAVKAADPSIDNSTSDGVHVVSIMGSQTINLKDIVDANPYDLDVVFDLEEEEFSIEGKTVSHMMRFLLTEESDPEPASLTLNKTFSDDNDSEVAFELWLNDEMVRSGTTSGQSITFGELEAGTYEIVESGSPSGYMVSIEGGDEVTLEEGDNATVKVTNTLITEETTPGAIRITKTFTDQSTQEVTFHLWAGDEEVRSENTSGQAVVFENLTPGAYTLTESGYEGAYTMTVWVDEEEVESIAVITDEETEVVVVNSPRQVETTPGSITVNKTFSDGNLAEVTIDLRQGETVVRSELTSGQSITFNDLAPGAYTVVESGSPAGYTVSVEGGATVELAAGGSVTKTVVNTLIPDDDDDDDNGGGGGGGGGGGDDDDDIVTDIDEEPTPEAPIEVTETEEPEAPLEILEEIVPLADVPQTGIGDNVPLLLTMLALSLAGLALVARRRPAGEMK